MPVVRGDRQRARHPALDQREVRHGAVGQIHVPEQAAVVVPRDDVALDPDRGAERGERCQLGARLGREALRGPVRAGELRGVDPDQPDPLDGPLGSGRVERDVDRVAVDVADDQAAIGGGRRRRTGDERADEQGRAGQARSDSRCSRISLRCPTLQSARNDT